METSVTSTIAQIMSALEETNQNLKRCKHLCNRSRRNSFKTQKRNTMRSNLAKHNKKLLGTALNLLRKVSGSVKHCRSNKKLQREHRGITEEILMHAQVLHSTVHSSPAASAGVNAAHTRRTFSVASAPNRASEHVKTRSGAHSFLVHPGVSSAAGRRPRRGQHHKQRCAVLDAAVTSLTSLCTQLQQAHLVLLRELARHVGETAAMLGINVSLASQAPDDANRVVPWFEALYALTRDVKHRVADVMGPAGAAPRRSLETRIMQVFDSLHCNLLNIQISD